MADECAIGSEGRRKGEKGKYVLDRVREYCTRNGPLTVKCLWQSVSMTVAGLERPGVDCFITSDFGMVYEGELL